MGLLRRKPCTTNHQQPNLDAVKIAITDESTEN